MAFQPYGESFSPPFAMTLLKSQVVSCLEEAIQLIKNDTDYLDIFSTTALLKLHTWAAILTNPHFNQARISQRH